MRSAFYTGIKFGFGLIAGIYIALVAIGILTSYPMDDNGPSSGRGGTSSTASHMQECR